MTLKKCNALLTLIMVAALLCHIGAMAITLATGCFIGGVFWKMMTHIALLCFVLHVVISIIMFFFRHDGRALSYARLNKKMVLQRVTALLLLILIHTHRHAYGFILTGTPLTTGGIIFRLITECLLCGAVMCHIAASFGNAILTLGLVTSEKALARIDKVAYSLCAVLLVAAAGSVIIFFTKGLAV
ncbi:MAG: hypothetical protein Q4B73_04620 [Lachnospiraceae bacterium]|nr:hypothetical protein [Lachnospiraceae bacterium]